MTATAGAAAECANQQVFRDAAVVREYFNQDYLEAPERLLIDRLGARLRDMSMLDIGVGCGRTTTHFAERVADYVGVDYAAEMVAACEYRFRHCPDSVQFQVCDMRYLDGFADHSFDFVLISYNTISTVSHEDRLRTLREVHRVCKPGGYLLFSAHNLQSVHKLFGWHCFRRSIELRHPHITYWNLRRWWLRGFVYNNPLRTGRLKRFDHVVFNDGCHDFRLRHYYIKPAAQVRQLSELFSDVEVYARDGRVLRGETAQARAEDDWLYYLCRNR